MACVVSYRGAYFLYYRNNASGLAQLIKADGTKYSGTPRPEHLDVVKKLESRSYNGHEYVSTKQGVFSLSTGAKMVHPDILRLF